MPHLRRTFIIRVHEPARAATVQDVRTGERVRVHQLSTLGAAIEHWLRRSPDREAATQPARTEESHS